MGLQCFRYERPAEIAEHERVTVDIFRSEVADARVLVLDHVGETHLHSHYADEAVWFVLAGRAVFYDEENTPHELGPREGVVIPRRTKYWFEAVGDEPLEIFRVAGKDRAAVASPADLADMERIIALEGPPRHPHVPVEGLASNQTN